MTKKIELGYRFCARIALSHSYQLWLALAASWLGDVPVAIRRLFSIFLRVRPHLCDLTCPKSSRILRREASWREVMSDFVRVCLLTAVKHWQLKERKRRSGTGLTDSTRQDTLSPFIFGFAFKVTWRNFLLGDLLRIKSPISFGRLFKPTVSSPVVDEIWNFSTENFREIRILSSGKWIAALSTSESKEPQKIFCSFSIQIGARPVSRTAFKDFSEKQNQISTFAITPKKNFQNKRYLICWF